MELPFLDLSAAFDTIDHGVLLTRMETGFGVTGEALKWIRSYLTDRYKSVKVRNSLSAKSRLAYGVPQGSVLVRLLFTLYTAPLSDVLKKYGVNYHLYADDTRVYLAFNPKDKLDVKKAVDLLEQCLLDIKGWMTNNMLKLNKDETEILVISTPAQIKKNQLTCVSFTCAVIIILSYFVLVFYL